MSVGGGAFSAGVGGGAGGGGPEASCIASGNEANEGVLSHETKAKDKKPGDVFGLCAPKGRYDCVRLLSSSGRWLTLNEAFPAAAARDSDFDEGVCVDGDGDGERLLLLLVALRKGRRHSRQPTHDLTFFSLATECGAKNQHAHEEAAGRQTTSRRSE